MSRNRNRIIGTAPFAGALILVIAAVSGCDDGPDVPVCEPVCAAGQECGGDGCGGTCGDFDGGCPDGLACDGAACIENPCPQDRKSVV